MYNVFHLSPSLTIGNKDVQKTTPGSNNERRDKAPKRLTKIRVSKSVIVDTIVTHLDNNVEFFRDSQLVNIESSVACISAKRPFSVTKRFPIMG